MFSQLGSEVIDADKLGHQVLEEQAVREKIKQIWGDRVIRADRVNRSVLAEIVFDPDRGADDLEILESLTHPRIRQLMTERLIELRRERCPSVVLDAPLLFEAGWDDLCDKVVFVDCDEQTRVKRALQRGWTPEEFRTRELRQMAINTKRKRATDIVDNSGELRQTKENIQRLWNQWRLPAK